jgi:2-oxoglutarate ferredoxin oxidoreductase subunit alpha
MNETGNVFIQAGSELGAINMVFGASAAGVRAMTSSSSPGISLKQEGISYLAGCELPAVIVNVMRGGPGLGNIAPSQADYFQAVKGGGHGDYNVIALAPSSVQEMFEHTYTAFDLADKYRNPVFVLSDGLLGQMMEPVNLSSVEPDPKQPQKPWAMTGCAGRKPNMLRSLLLSDGALEEHNKKLQEKFGLMKKDEVRVETFNLKDADTVIVAFGSVARTAKASMLKARAKGRKVGLIRPITLWPFPGKTIEAAAATARRFIVVEMNAGQMVEDVRLALNGRSHVDFYGRMGGGIPTEDEISARVEAVV